MIYTKRLYKYTLYDCPELHSHVSFSRSAALSRLLGNVVLKNKKAQFVITNKLLLLQYKYKVNTLQRK